MLVLRRKATQWIEITHRSGDVLRVRVNDIDGVGDKATVVLGFDDASRHFEIERPERAGLQAAREAERLAGLNTRAIQ